MEIIPNEDRVVIKLAKKEEITKENIQLPEGSDDSNRIGFVVRTDTKNEKWLQKGDKVLFTGYNEEDIVVNGQKYIVIYKSKILAKLEDNVKCKKQEE